MEKNIPLPVVSASQNKYEYCLPLELVIVPSASTVTSQQTSCLFPQSRPLLLVSDIGCTWLWIQMCEFPMGRQLQLDLYLSGFTRVQQYDRLSTSEDRIDYIIIFHVPMILPRVKITGVSI